MNEPTEQQGRPGRHGLPCPECGALRAADNRPSCTCAQRASERLGTVVDVLVDTVEDGAVEGRAAHQAPEVDGSVTLVAGEAGVDLAALLPGDLVRATVTGTEGVDLVAVPTAMISAAAR